MKALLGLLAFAVPLWAGAPFAIHVVDRETGRGIPLVELETANNIVYLTDSAGWVAFDEPGLMDREVFFTVRNPGYSFPKDGFGYAGKTLTTRAGGGARLELERLNRAERLYRVTGQGVYRDSVLLGKTTPLAEPVINVGIVGRTPPSPPSIEAGSIGSGATPASTAARW